MRCGHWLQEELVTVSHLACAVAGRESPLAVALGPELT